MIPPLHTSTMWRIASYWFDKCYRNAGTRAVKSGQLGGNADTFIKPIFSADNLDFLVTIFLKIFLYKNIVFYW